MILYRTFQKLDADERGFTRKNQLKIRVFSVHPRPKWFCTVAKKMIKLGFTMDFENIVHGF